MAKKLVKKKKEWNEETVQALIEQEGVKNIPAQRLAYHWFWMGFKAAKGENI